jgi:hypothetical protein
MTGEEGVQLAEVNVALPRAPLDAPAMAAFVRAVDDVNWLAERSPGFVWRRRPEDGPVVLAPFEGDEVIVTLSTWTDFESLQRYVYRSAHALFMRKRGSWFVPLNGFTTALWWVAAGDQPSVDEGLDRLSHLRLRGPKPYAFSVRRQFTPAEAEAAAGAG